MTRLLLSAALLAGTTSPLMAETDPALIYEQFEIAVPHIDLDACPDELAQDGVFCRGTINQDELHVFVFAEEGAQPLRAMQSYPLNALAGLLE